jgi:MerR family transcriptional regulator, light-induced transcriptional regulator
MKQSYSTKELAQMLDVSESTVKRWADAGLLKCRKTIGGHRKFHQDEIAEFQSQCSLAVKAAMAEDRAARRDAEMDELFAGPDFTALSGRYREASLARQFGCATAMLREAHLRGLSLATIGDEIIRPAMHEIGEMWRAGKISVLDEHAATFATVRALIELRQHMEEKERTEKLALVGCSEGEFHHVAALLVCHLLESESWKVVYLGGHTPLFSFAEAINKLNADLACISITMTDNIERAARDYEGLRRAALKRNAKIILGGAALKDEEVRARFRGASYARTLQEFTGLLNHQ